MKTLQILGNTAFGGATRLVLDWCKYLNQKGWTVEVLTTDGQTGLELKKIDNIVIQDGILIPREIDPVQDIRAALALYRLIKSGKYDVVHTYSATPSFIGRLAGFLAGVPVVHHQAGWTINEANSPAKKILFQSLEAAAICMSSRSICVSHAIAAQGKALPLIPKAKLTTICNGITVKPLLEAPPAASRERLCDELGISKSACLIGNTGRLAAQKDPATLIRAVSELKKDVPNRDIKLLLVGEGPERETLAALVETLGLHDEVRFLGFRSDIPEFLASLDVFASPSLWEGLSISILEAMAAKKPIVASSIPPNSELIEHEVTGLLVPETSPKELARAIQRFISDTELAKRCAQAAQTKVLEHYTIERMFAETYQLYLDLLA
ncbi:MAG TPA: glycosyltransferase family 4 protein [Anaerolineaceae bacterium]|nr:glycosyltransferase family 4 protein [Anaerolineaceae bacterium]